MEKLECKKRHICEFFVTRHTHSMKYGDWRETYEPCTKIAKYVVDYQSGKNKDDRKQKKVCGTHKNWFVRHKFAKHKQIIHGEDEV